VLARGRWSFGDAWDFLANGTLSLRALAAPHLGHWTAVPLVVYRLLWELSRCAATCRTWLWRTLIIRTITAPSAVVGADDIWVNRSEPLDMANAPRVFRTVMRKA
jgi:hypothetical protein